MSVKTLLELLQRFQYLSQQYQTGRLSKEQFYTEAMQLQAQDENGCWWRVNPENGIYLRYDGHQWVKESLPIKNIELPHKTSDLEIPKVTLRYRYGSGGWNDVSLISEITIGRSHDCELILDDGAVSRHHARFTIKSGNVFITDLNSSNGTRVNKRMITPGIEERILPGQIITMGSVTFMIVTDGMPVRTPLVESPYFQEPPKKSIPNNAGKVPEKLQPVQHNIQNIEVKSKSSASYPAKKQEGGLWIAFIMIGGGLFLCLCVVVSGGILWVKGFPQKKAATNIAEVSILQVLSETTSPASQATPLVMFMETPVSDQPVLSTVSAETLEESTAISTWLIMFYNDADDMNIEGPLYLNVSEAEMVGSKEHMNIVTQLDLYQGGFEALNGDWTTTKRYFLTEKTCWNYIESQEISDLGEQNMGDPATLVDFAVWAVNTYPADRYALIMTDHGDGWMGGWYDENPSPDDVGQFEVHIELAELEQALSYITMQTGIEKLDLIGLDACLMSSLEVYTSLEPYAHYAVASQEVEPFFGWAYASFLSDLAKDPSMDGAGLADSIVRSYIEEDFVIVNEDARYEVFDYGITESDVIFDYFPTTTLSAVDLSAISDVNQALNRYVDILMTADQSSVAWARTNAQHFYDIFMDEDDPLHSSSNIDLGNFSYLTAETTGNPDLLEASEKLRATIDNAILVEKHGDERALSEGISIFFPVSDVYQVTYENIPYPIMTGRFSEISKWDDFLYFHYTQ